METNSSSVKHLNSFLRGEVSAVETYRQAIEKVKDVSAKTQLLDCVQSHERSVQLLRDRITQLGGEPATGSGPWGGFAKLVEGAASVMGDKAAISALEEGEDHGLADYRRDVADLDPESRSLVQSQLLPAQEKTHAALSSLKRIVS